MCQDNVNTEATTVVDIQIVDPATSQTIETNRKDRSYGKFFYAINTGSRAQATKDLGIIAPNNALEMLIETGIARIGVESRNVSTTNVPYVGPVVFQNGNITNNAGCRSRLFETTYLQRQMDADAADTLITKNNTI